jgi:HPr kinase/phosphorylase
MSVIVETRQFEKELRLRCVVEGRDTIEIRVADVHRPGLQMTGYFEDFVYERVQVIGNAEMHYLMKLDAKVRQERMDKYLSYPIPALICTNTLEPPEELIRAAERNDVPVFVSERPTTQVTHRLSNYLDQKLAPQITQHGGLVDVYGGGIMRCGEAGIGKSETALELIKRSHRLVADDAVNIRRVAADRLVGSSPELVRQLMEIRGIGIIDVRHMYGVGSVLREKSINFIIELEMWREDKNYSHVDTDEQHREILDVRVPYITVPVRPGRNLAIIIEVAARNYLLKGLGYDAAKEFDRRWELLAQSHQEDE